MNQFRDGTLFVLLAPPGALSGGMGLIEGNEWVLSRYSPEGEFLNKIAEARESTRWGHSIASDRFQDCCLARAGRPMHIAGLDASAGR